MKNLQQVQMQLPLSSSRLLLLHVLWLFLSLSLPQVAFSDKLRSPVTASTGTNTSSSSNSNSICEDDVQLKVSLKAVSDPVCRSKGFIYQGGPCSPEAVTANICRDYYKYDNEVIHNHNEAATAFLLVTNVHNSSVIYYSGYVQANNNGIFNLPAATSTKEDVLISVPEQLSVQVYTDESLKEIRQRMIVPAPCFLSENDSSSLDWKDLPETPVRLAFTAHQPSVKTYQVSLEATTASISRGDWILESLKVMQPTEERELELEQKLNDDLHVLPFQMEFETSLKEEESFMVVAKLVSTTDSNARYCFLETQVEDVYDNAGGSVAVTAF